MTFTPPTKRTHGQCTCPPPSFTCSEGRGSHRPDCPALYPLQPQPGDEPDALTKLTRWLRLAPADVRDTAAWEHDALDLISEAREQMQHLEVLADKRRLRIRALETGAAHADNLLRMRDQSNEALRSECDAAQAEVAKWQEQWRLCNDAASRTLKMGQHQGRAELAQEILLGTGLPPALEAFLRVIAREE